MNPRTTAVDLQQAAAWIAGISQPRGSQALTEDATIAIVSSIDLHAQFAAGLPDDRAPEAECLRPAPCNGISLPRRWPLGFALKSSFFV
jgi:hypothetical protein